MPSAQTLVDRCSCHEQPIEDGAAQGEVSIEAAANISALE
jgi:hypothetical protein